MIQTAVPVKKFKIQILRPLIPGKDTSIDRCIEYIETNASARDKFLSIFFTGDALRFAFTIAVMAIVIFENA